MMYRIRAVAPDKYVVEKKRWYGLYTCCLYECRYDDFERACFSSVDEAKLALWKYLQNKRDVAKHVAQPPIYTTGL